MFDGVKERCLRLLSKALANALRTNSDIVAGNLSRCLPDILHKAMAEERFDIRAALQRRALAETAAFVEQAIPLYMGYKDRHALLEAALEVASAQGLFLEFGVYEGKTINFIAAHRTDVTVYGFDSFEGLAEPWIFRREGAFSVDGLPEVRENVQLVKGWFAETLRAFLKEHTETCAFIHIDCDVYSSAKTVLGCLEQRIAAGTVIVFDEFFNYPGWREGEYKAFMEFVDQIGARFEYVGYTYQKTDKHRSGQQVAVKLTGFG